MTQASVIRFPSHRARRDREPLVKKAEVAKGLHVSERWIELKMKHEGFPHHKDERSRLVYFRWSEIDEWMAGRSTA